VVFYRRFEAGVGGVYGKTLVVGKVPGIESYYL
jgi:hypothetical protein